MPTKKKTKKRRKPPVAIVTGGAGFIGSHVVDELVRRRYKVVVIDDLSSGRADNVNPNVKFLNISVTSPKKIMEVFEKYRPKYVFHFAAQILPRVSVEHPIKDAKINILGTINVLEACREAGVEKVVVASSGGVMYPNHVIGAKESDVICPETPYGISKRAKELYLDHYHRVFGLEYVALRFANIYGPRQTPKGGIEGGVIPIFADQMLRGKDCYITGSGKQTRDFVYVKDVVRACMASIKSSFVGIVNISSGKEVSVKHIYKTTAKVTGSKQKPKILPSPKGEKRRSCMSPAKARRVLDWKPEVTLEEGIRKTARYLKKQMKS